MKNIFFAALVCVTISPAIQSAVESIWTDANDKAAMAELARSKGY